MALRIVLMSDIHGNLPALQSVAGSLPEHDAVIVAGDLCLDGPDPAAVLDTLDDLGWYLLVGNTDRDIVTSTTDEDSLRGRIVAWTRQQLGPSRLRRLAELDFSARFSGAGGGHPVLSGAPESGDSPLDDHRAADGRSAGSSNDLLAVHANPRNLDDQLYPTLSREELKPYLSNIQADILAFGHLHIPYVRPVEGVLLIDVSSVGHPKDGDLRAGYTLLTLDGDCRSVTQARVPYDVDRTVHRMRHCGMPDAEVHSSALLRASYGPSKPV